MTQILISLFHWLFSFLWLVAFVVFVVNRRYINGQYKFIGTLVVTATVSWSLFMTSDFLRAYVQLLMSTELDTSIMRVIPAVISLLVVLFLIFWWLPKEIQKGLQIENDILKRAHYDMLTGLPNRSLALDRLNEAVTRAQVGGHKMAVIFFDLDSFKKVNNSIGHKTGDELLKQTAARLQKLTGQLSTVARLGADEFLLILPEIKSTVAVEKLAMRLNAAFFEPFVLGEQEVTVTASMGISVYPTDGEDALSLLQDATSALHKAKEKGANTFHFYTEDIHNQALERLKLEEELRLALDRKELEVFYQPIIDTRTKSLVGAEALLRWTNKELGFVSPADFIPIAEDIGMIVPIGEWVLEEAFKQVKAWVENPEAPDYVTVNVSPRQFRDVDFVGRVAEIVEKSGVHPSHIKLEVTESLLVGDVDNVEEMMNQLKAIGLRLSLDDFGTGYSSLSYLKKYDFDTLKIDRAFIKDIPDDKGDCALVDAILALSESLGLEVVAEGVETVEQFDYLKEHGCGRIQGFLFSKPLNVSDFEDFILGWRKNKKG